MYIDPIFLALIIVVACFVSGFIGAAYVDIRHNRYLLNIFRQFPQ